MRVRKRSKVTLLSRQDLSHHVPMHVGQAEIAALVVGRSSFVWSMPRQCRIVACRSCTWTGSCVDVVAVVVGGAAASCPA